MKPAQRDAEDEPAVGVDRLAQQRVVAERSAGAGDGDAGAGDLGGQEGDRAGWAAAASSDRRADRRRGQHA